ncbi:trace amine-associated receptor 1 [Culex quinquefasciatus]|uniref:trace amine-associated receptor 1 n=1 Tax=Culex quinquefasciatus TaxID=7176 RepID=UPI0018E3DEC6|nr:trace amine-associated receptor 1 [Culex quinquefasciatus]XP_038112474.1 trace amine-associated receptor 1 [Culex quinquefasciatus]
MDLKAGKHLVAPAINNISCSEDRFAKVSFLGQLHPFDVLQALFIVFLTFLVISANLMVILIINSRRYAAYIHPQPRYLLTSLALNDLAIGVLIIPFGALPALLHCWPYGEIFCQIQALLRGALSQQSAVILVCMAVDRYLCVLHPRIYHERSSKKGCVAILSVTWILCLTCFGLLVLPKGYYFNKSGLLACEPFYSKSSYRILSSCALYFPTTMVLMYCYGSSFHANRYRLATPAGAGATASSMAIAAVGASTATATTTTEIGGNSSCAGTPTGISVATPSSMSFSEKLAEHDQRLNGSTSRTMAAISLGFIVIITPWTIQEIVATCTGSKIPPSIDFCVTWIALSSSFWNPFLYWLLNARFRRICKEMLSSRCTSSQTSLEEKCSISLEYDHHMTTLPLPPGPPPATICRSANHTPRPDIECTSERYWGDILERTFSSCSINALPRSNSSSAAYHQQQQHQTTTLHRHHHRQNGGGHHRSNNSIHKLSPGGEHLCKEHRRPGTGSKESEFTVIFPTTNSDPQMSCERELHDINCAKNRAFFVGFNHHQALPDI